MTDRPRRWTLVDFGDQLRAVGPSLARPNYVDVVEWDREKVEAAITRALTDLLDRKPDSTAYGMARAIFDALDREQT